MRLVSYPIRHAFTSAALGVFLLAGALAPSSLARADEVVGFQDARGNTVFLHDFRGRVVVINLWASWCAPCIQEMPSLALLQSEYAKKGLVVLALTEDTTMAPALHFYDAHNIHNLTPFLDPGHKVMMALQARGIPTSVLVSRSGQASARLEGPINWQSVDIYSKLDKLLSEILAK